MFYFLSKAIDFLVMPFSIFFILSIFAFCIKNQRRKRLLFILAFGWLFLTANSFLVNKLFNWWEYKFINISELDKTYDVGIVLGGGLLSVPTLKADHPILGNHADRFSEAFLLYKAGKIKKILLTGTSAPYLMAVKKGETRQAAKLLAMWGIRPEDIIFEDSSRNTRENATFTAKILNTKFPGKRYLLITSSFHMRRSLGCFAKANVKVDPFPANFYGGNYPINFKDLLIPDSETFAYFELLWREWVGYIMYKLAGYC